MTNDNEEPSAASAGSVAGKPVAWMVTDPSGRIEACRESFGEPSLTGMERDAVNAAMELVGTQTIKATLRGLLERTR